MTQLSKEQKKAWHADPANWRMGLFYFNPEDPRLLPPKRLPIMGWTVNFANPRSILFLLGIVVAVLGAVWALEHYGVL